MQSPGSLAPGQAPSSFPPYRQGNSSEKPRLVDGREHEASISASEAHHMGSVFPDLPKHLDAQGPDLPTSLSGNHWSQREVRIMSLSSCNLMFRPRAGC